MKFNLEKAFFFLYFLFSFLTLVKPGYNNFPLQLNNNLTYFLGLFFGLLTGIICLNKIPKSDLKYSLKKNPFFLFFLFFISISFILNLVGGLFDVYASVKTFGFLTIGMINYYLIPLRFKLDSSLFKLWGNFIIYISVLVSLIAILGVFEFPVFFYWNSFDEKILVINMRSTASILFEPNIYAYLIMFGIFFTDLKHYSKIKKISILTILILGLFFSYGRGAWMCVIIYYFISFFLKSKYKKAIIILSFIFFVQALYFILQSQELFDILNLDNPLTGRLSLWFNSFRLSQNNLFFGIGMSAESLNAIFLKMGHNYTTSHNVLIDSLLTNGLIATIFYIFAFLRPMIINLKGRQNQKLFSFLISIFIFLQFSPHNIGGVSFMAVSTGIIFGIINFKDIYE